MPCVAALGRPVSRVEALLRSPSFLLTDDLSKLLKKLGVVFLEEQNLLREFLFDSGTNP